MPHRGKSVSANPAALRHLLQQIGLELASVEMTPERPAAALADLIAATEAAAAGSLEGVAEAAALARGWVADQGTPLAADVRRLLAAWHDWMEQVVTAWERGRPLPGRPAELPREAASPAMPQRSAAIAEQTVPLLPAGIDAEMMQLFCTDCEDFLRDIEQGVLVLEERPDDPDTLNSVFRAFHTFKGNAGMLKLAVLQRVAHELESLLESARRGAVRLGRAEIDAILAGADLFTRYVAAVSDRLAGRRSADSVSLPVNAVIDAVQAGLEGGFDAAVEREQLHLVDLRHTPEARRKLEAFLKR